MDCDALEGWIVTHIPHCLQLSTKFQPASSCPDTSEGQDAIQGDLDSMATEMDSCCPICLDTLKEISYIFPCLHQFCYTCILQWAENTPKCPLCKRRILSILHSTETENNYIEHPSYGVYCIIKA
uniref:RING-type E3 ubiquitin transferase n=1 Tax=Zonotrichia albicollis TaxID=44394 RepID=A0A8D2LYF3_ZONAL